jgi:hypothetical protein
MQTVVCVQWCAIGGTGVSAKHSGTQSSPLNLAAWLEQLRKEDAMPDDDEIYGEAVEIERHPGRKHTRAELRRLRTALKAIYK